MPPVTFLISDLIMVSSVNGKIILVQLYKGLIASCQRPMFNNDPIFAFFETYCLSIRSEK